MRPFFNCKRVVSILVWAYKLNPVDWKNVTPNPKFPEKLNRLKFGEEKLFNVFRVLFPELSPSMKVKELEILTIVPIPPLT